MAIKNIIARGVGFSAGSTKWIPTAGYSSAAPPPPSETRWIDRQARVLGWVDLVKHPFIIRKY